MSSDISNNSNDSKDNNSSYESDENDDEEEKSSQAECIRNRSNFSVVKSFHMIDKKDFDKNMVKLYIDNEAAPKLKLLMQQIKRLDKKDMKTSGKLYKHLIFTDVNRSAYGVKIIASTLAASGMNMAMHPQGTGFAVYSDDELLNNKYNNFAVLISKSFYDRPMNIKIRKSILEKFNLRPDNIHGDLIRFIILDQGFKEGIDLFDVKYVHLLEPLVVKADEKQAIGRATRFCGQKGLEFHPTFGWPLYVFKYDIEIPQNIQPNYSNAKTLFELYLKYSNIDMRKIVFAAELENATINAAVDQDLTRSIHTFSIDKPSPILKDTDSYSSTGGSSKAPPKKMNLQDMKQYISKHFMRIRYPRVQLENNCQSGGNNGNIVSFTPTQEFIRQYFQPASAYKGILLHHSVGTGKTCTAIATATTSFDIQGYTILWVTRHTLKNDIWKNMYGQVCSIDVQNKIKSGLVLPKTITNKFKYISQNWMEPISYKQFSNMLLKKNKIYNEMVRRNGVEDPLRKTLLIVDEAHKIYSPTVAKSEKPDTNILEKMLQNSYDISGKDSVRIMLMTATPFTEDGMEMVQLLNLLRENNKLPVKFDEFANQYLDDNGYFTKKGLKSFQDNISGYISYLNRSQDARNFAHPVIENVYAKLSLATAPQKTKNTYDIMLQEAKGQSKTLKDELKELKILQKSKKIDKSRIKDCINKAKNEFNQKNTEAKANKKAEEERCKTLPVKERKGCKDTIVEKYNKIIEDLQNQRDVAIEECKQLQNNNPSYDAINVQIENLTKQINEYKQKINEYKNIKKERKIKLKDIRQDVKGTKIELKQKQKEVKDLIMQLKTSIKQFNNISDKKERAKVMREFKKQNPLVQRIKDLKKEIKDYRVDVSRGNIRVKNMQIEDGKSVLKNISQQYALGKYCKV